MNDFYHADISRCLALAIGWRDDQLFNDHDGSYTSVNLSNHPFIQTWKDFDYRDPLVIWPIAERFDCFPWKSGGMWKANNDGGELQVATYAARAVALAVIKSKGET